MFNGFPFQISGTHGENGPCALVKQFHHCHRVGPGVQETVEIRAVGSINRGGRLGTECTEHGSVAGILFLVNVAEQGIYNIHPRSYANILLNLRVHIVTERELVEGGVLDDTFLVVPVDAEIMSDILGAAGRGEVIVLKYARAGNCVLPVGGTAFAEELQFFGRPGIWLAGFLHEFVVLCCVHHVLLVEHLLNAILGEEGYPALAGFTPAGSDEHNAVRASGAVDGCRGGIFKHFD